MSFYKLHPASYILSVIHRSHHYFQATQFTFRRQQSRNDNEHSTASGGRCSTWPRSITHQNPDTRDISQREVGIKRANSTRSRQHQLHQRVGESGQAIQRYRVVPTRSFYGHSQPHTNAGRYHYGLCSDRGIPGA